MSPPIDMIRLFALNKMKTISLSEWTYHTQIHNHNALHSSRPTCHQSLNRFLWEWLTSVEFWERNHVGCHNVIAKIAQKKCMLDKLFAKAELSFETWDGSWATRANRKSFLCGIQVDLAEKAVFDLGNWNSLNFCTCSQFNYFLSRAFSIAFTEISSVQIFLKRGDFVQADLTLTSTVIWMSVAPLCQFP